MCSSQSNVYRLTADFSSKSIKAEHIGMTSSECWRGEKNLSTEKSMSSKLSFGNESEDISRETEVYENLSSGDL